MLGLSETLLHLINAGANTVTAVAVAVASRNLKSILKAIRGENERARRERETLDA